MFDTDTCIEILRGNRRVLTRRASETDLCGTTWITACELFYGAARSRDPSESRIAVADLLRDLPLLAQGLVSAECYGRFRARLESNGERLDDADLLIASLAVAHGAILVTGNVRHFERIPELQIEDWIRGSRGSS